MAFHCRELPQTEKIQIFLLVIFLFGKIFCLSSTTIREQDKKNCWPIKYLLRHQNWDFTRLLQTWRVVWNPLLNNFDTSIYFSNKMAFHCYYSISAGVGKYLHILDIFNLLLGSLWSFIFGNFYREHQISWKI